MPYCPICRAEFRQGFTHCASCDVNLVDHLAQAAPRMDDASMAQYLAGQELVLLANAPLERLKPLKNLLCENGIANMVIREADSCGSGNCITGGCAPSLQLVIAAADAEHALGMMQAEFNGLVDGVREEADAEAGDGVVALDEAEFPCPACGDMVKGGSAECPHCGLYVGVPDEFLAADSDE